jgi:myo-inositol 2-dehydrogenase / D-chiro-inositol 1-dehydrogenase
MADMNRRGFLKGASAAGVLIVSPQVACGAAANERLRLGVIGCGGRGPWIGHLFEENTNTKVVALHDYFKDRVDKAGEQLEVPPDKRFIGMDGYHELIASGVDAVAVESPPYFHPEQTVAALEAGKHVYLAKPIAVDVPGCQAILKAGAATRDRLSLLVDFQTRNNELYREAAKRVHEGAIGQPVCGQVYYHSQRLGIRTEPGSEVARLRNWVFDKRLSGDIIVEQNIHVLDVANWLLRSHPTWAQGTGARRARTDVGDCWDQFMVHYGYPENVLIDFGSTQFTTGFEALCTRVFGSEGTVDTNYGGDVWVHNREGRWRGGKTSQIYQQGAVNNMKDFHAAVIGGTPITNIEDSARSTMTSILGRMAAYSGERVTWQKMLDVGERLDPALNLPEDGPLRTS